VVDYFGDAACRLDVGNELGSHFGESDGKRNEHFHDSSGGCQRAKSNGIAHLDGQRATATTDDNDNVAARRDAKRGLQCNGICDRRSHSVLVVDYFGDAARRLDVSNELGSHFGNADRKRNEHIHDSSGGCQRANRNGIAIVDDQRATATAVDHDNVTPRRDPEQGLQCHGICDRWNHSVLLVHCLRESAFGLDVGIEYGRDFGSAHQNRNEHIYCSGNGCEFSDGDCNVQSDGQETLTLHHCRLMHF
jgi:hypothetical protein